MQARPEENGEANAEEKERRHRVHLVESVQHLLSIIANDADLSLIQAAWTFRQHLTNKQQQAPSRLSNVLVDAREGKLDSATAEAQFYELGATRTVGVFLEALQEVPLTGSPGEPARRQEAIQERGGEHAVQAYNAAEQLLGDGNIDKAKSRIHDYGGTQAVTMYAIIKKSDPSIDRVIRKLSPNHISCLLDCISNVRLHPDVLYTIETRFRHQMKPYFKPQKTYVGRAPRSKGGSRKRDQMRQPAPQPGDPAAIPHTARKQQDETGFDALCSFDDANQVGYQPQHGVLPTIGTHQLDQSTSWTDPSARGTDKTMGQVPQGLVPDANEGILLDRGDIRFSEQDLSLFVQADFHFSGSL